LKFTLHEVCWGGRKAIMQAPVDKSNERRRQGYRTRTHKKKARLVDRIGLFAILWYREAPGESGKWWSRGELNPRPSAITGQFYMRSSLIWVSHHRSRRNTLPVTPATWSRPLPS